MGERCARWGSRSRVCRKAFSAAVAAASVSPRPGQEYIRRAHGGSSATASAASPPHAPWAGVRYRTQVGIGGTVAAFEHTERSLANHVRRAEDIAIDITAATERVAQGEDPDAAFPAVPGQQCSWCDFRPSCPTGQAAVPSRETWSFLPEDDPGT